VDARISDLLNRLETAESNTCHFRDKIAIRDAITEIAKIHADVKVRDQILVGER
jgi:hypothetical protein